MSVIAPTVTSENPDDYKMQIEHLHPFAERVHIDLSDGEFAPRFLINPNQIWWPPEWKVDIHAMVARPSEHVETLIAMKPHMIIFHAEVEEDLVPIIERIKRAEIRAGLALLRQTVPLEVEAAVRAADHVMIFSGSLGQQGGTASMMQLEKVRLVKNINPQAEIGWDGGVNAQNAFSLAQGGADVLNVGQALSQANDPQKIYDTLITEINKHGVI